MGDIMVALSIFSTVCLVYTVVWHFSVALLKPFHIREVLDLLQPINISLLIKSLKVGCVHDLCYRC